MATSNGSWLTFVERMDSGIAAFEAMHMEDLGFEIDIGELHPADF
jgi:hypothetical protein